MDYIILEIQQVKAYSFMVYSFTYIEWFLKFKIRRLMTALILYIVR